MTQTANTFFVECTSCSTSFPVDPDKVPEGGVLARCSTCNGVFRVEVPESQPEETISVGEFTPPEPESVLAEEPSGAQEPLAPSEGTVTASREPVAEMQDTTAEAPPEPPVAESPAATETEEAARPAFGQRDPEQKARRLARVLVSDMITYNPDRHARAMDAGTLATDFEDEIQKSWNEYVDQVGEELAESTPFFTDALNEILAGGNKIF